jgi:stress-induced-phosphoprotein 1
LILGFTFYYTVRYKYIISAVIHFQDLKSAKTAYEKSMSEFRTPEIKALLSEVEKQIKEEERKAYIDPVKAEEEKEKGNELFKNGL